MGRTDRDATFVHPRHWYADHGIDLRTGVAVTRIDLGRHEVTLATAVTSDTASCC